MSSTISSTATATSSAPTQTTTQSNPSGGPSSPLLFFVALGFGVVFTNLWIIVGVKYCFRYNQRNRARLAGEDPDAVDLAAMPRQRRRREKKLMTMDEVNEKFPLTKYKTWCSTRAEEGLPTAGGIDTTRSRPASIRSLPRPSEDDTKTKAQPSTTEALAEKLSPSEPSSPIALKHGQTKVTTTQTTAAVPEGTAVQKVQSHDDDDGENDQIQTAIPAEQLPDPGDTCAICIDALEDDDDIRGLTCGHAFHASCVDPWLTARRACCPLCKADYYTPKPRPEGETEDLQRRRTLEQQPPGFILIDRRRGPPFTAIGRYFFGGPRPAAPTAGTSPTIPRPTRDQLSAPSQPTSAPPTEQQQQSWRTRLNLPRIPPLSRVRQTNDVQPNPTPAHLEAGQNR